MFTRHDPEIEDVPQEHFDEGKTCSYTKVGHLPSWRSTRLHFYLYHLTPRNIISNILVISLSPLLDFYYICWTRRPAIIACCQIATDTR